MKSYIKRHIIHIIMLVFASVIFTACNDDILPSPEEPVMEFEDGYVTVNVVASKAVTRGVLDEPGVDGLNENRINNVVLCLWPQTGDRPETSEPVYFNVFENLSATGSVTLRVPLTEGLRRQLFESEGDGTRCLAYAAVNVTPGQAKSVAELRNLVVSSTFASEYRQAFFTMDGDGAVALSPNGLAASAIIGVHRSACKITVEVDCDSELTENDAEGNPIVWKSDLSSISASLTNGVRTSTLTPRPYDNINSSDYFDTDPTKNYVFVNSTSDSKDKYPLIQQYPFYTYPNAWTTSPEEENRTFVTLTVPWSPDGGKSYRTCYYQVPVVPMQSTSLARNTSYHIRLHVGMLGSFTPDIPVEVPDLSYTAADWGEEDIDVAIEDYRFLVVEQNYFTVNNESTYQIPFYTSHKTEVVSAKLIFYRFNYSEEGTKFEVPIDWASSSNKAGNTQVFNVRFYNGDHATIPGNFLQFWHPLKMYQPVNANGNDIPLTKDQKTQTASEIKSALAKTAYYRQLTDDEFSRVDVEVTVQHSDMKGTDLWKETVYISQFPAIYIDARANFYKTTGGNISGTGAEASCYINGNSRKLGDSDSKDPDGWTTSIGLSSENYLNWNPNLYVITVTKLPDGSKYQIGDPRTVGINNLLQNWTMTDANSYKDFSDHYTTAATDPNYRPETPNYAGYKYNLTFTEADATDGTRRYLKWYYPTQEGGATTYMLAPKFRICSSYAGTGYLLNRYTARVRAAAYQEMNYPAGRWRLPTFGEVNFIMELSAQKKIPRLFGRKGTDWYYWCAQGAVFVAKKEEAETKLPYISDIANSSFERARFVYDEWYWDNDTISRKSGEKYYQFMWGDKERVTISEE